MKLFGRKSAPAEARPPLSRYGGSGTIGDWPRSYEAQVRSGFVENAIAQRSVRLVADGVASAPLSASAPELLALVAARSAGQALLEAVAAQLLLHGNAFVQVIDDGRGGAAELFALRPERVSIEPDANGWPAAYRYRVGDRVTRLSPDGPRPEVIHLKTFNPVDDHLGLGCLGAAAGAVAIHNAAAQWNKALLDNAARPSGALVYDPKDGSALAPAQFDRLKRELEASFSGERNAGRPMLLEGGLSWQALSLTPAEMDFAGLKAAASREIALAFGVPPMLLGLPGDATYANYREANRALWRLTVLPLARAILGGLGEGLKGWFPDAALTIDEDRVPALSEDRERLWAQVTAADFLSPEEKRAMVGLGAESVTEVLAQLFAAGRGEGADMATLRAIAEEAGELGASRALARLGLSDAAAEKDMAELRELLGAWRDAKKSVWKALIGWVARMLLALVLVGLAVRLGFSGYVK